MTPSPDDSSLAKLLNASGVPFQLAAATALELSGIAGVWVIAQEHPWSDTMGGGFIDVIAQWRS